MTNCSLFTGAGSDAKNASRLPATIRQGFQIIEEYCPDAALYSRDASHRAYSRYLQEGMCRSSVRCRYSGERAPLCPTMQLMLSQHFAESHDLAAVKLLKTFRRLNAGKGDDTGVAHNRRRIAPQKIEGGFRINEFGAEVVGGLQLFHLRPMFFHVPGNTCKTAEGDLCPVRCRQDMPGMHILVYPHAAEAAILPRFLRENTRRRPMKQCDQQK